VAASRDLGGSPAAPGKEENTMSKITMLAAAAALFGKPVVDEDQAVTELTALQAELPRLREFSGAVGKELGETDPAKAVAKVRELTAAVARHEQAAKDAQAAAMKTTVEATLKEHERSSSPRCARCSSASSRASSARGRSAKDTDVVKALTAAPATGITGRSSGTDLGGDVHRRHGRAARPRGEVAAGHRPRAQGAREDRLLPRARSGAGHGGEEDRLQERADGAREAELRPTPTSTIDHSHQITSSEETRRCRRPRWDRRAGSTRTPRSPAR
jgi:hypothetical protein